MPTTAYTNVLNLITSNLPTGGTPITASNHRDVENALLAFAESQWLTGDIKEIDCDQAYITANFSPTGMGIGQREGWAICNGQNGTKNRTGRVSVAWGVAGLDADANNIAQPLMNTGTFPTVGGTKAHVLEINEMPPHSHSIAARTGTSSTGNGGANFPAGANTFVASGTSGGNGSNGVGWNATSNPTTAPHNNMQPYIVTLFIQKL